MPPLKFEPRTLANGLRVIWLEDHAAPVVAIGALARYDRPAPTLTDYDDLLTGSRP